MRNRELLDFAEQKIFQISQQGARLRGSGPENINTVMVPLDNIQARHEAKGNLIGLTTGFKDVDDKTSGLQDSDLIIIAAKPPSRRKTSFAMNIAENAALEDAKQNRPQYWFFPWKCHQSKLVMRMISSLGRIELQRLRTGCRLRDEDWPLKHHLASCYVFTN